MRHRLAFHETRHDRRAYEGMQIVSFRTDTDHKAPHLSEQATQLGRHIIPAHQGLTRERALVTGLYKTLRRFADFGGQTHSSTPLSFAARLSFLIASCSIL